LAFAPDGRTLVTLNVNREIQIWETGTGEEVRLLWRPERRDAAAEDHDPLAELETIVRVPRNCLAFSPDGRMIAESASLGDLIHLWDMTGRTKPGGGLARTDLNPEERDRLWNDLNQAGASKAHQTLWALVAAGDEVVPFVLERLRPLDATTQRIYKLITDLDREEYDVRQAATKELEQIGPTAELAIGKALKNQPSLETRRRLEGLLEKIEPLGRVRLPRAVCVLEQIGTPAARRALEELEKGDLQSRLVQEARASLGRLARRR
jgi:hypothetical protein